MKPATIVAAFLTVLFAGSAAAALSQAHADWATGPVQHYLSKDELRQWKAIKTDDEAEKFIALFWARRDPTPATARNEFRERFDELVKFADDRFAQNKVRGSMTERGRALVLLGVPTRVRKAAGASGQQEGFSDEEEEGGGGVANPREIWIYEGDRVPPFLGTATATFEFADRFGTGDFRLSKSSSPSALAKAVTAAITQPDLKEVPPPAAAKVVEKQIPASEIKVAAELPTESLRKAAEALRTAAKNPYREASVTYGEFMTTGGDYFVPVQIWVPKGADLPAEGLTFFAVVTDAEGKAVAAVEEPATLTESKGDRFFDRSLTIGPGKYTAVLGLAKEGAPLLAAKKELEPKPIEKDGFSTSRMILSNNVFALPAAQLPTDPYAFGGLKVVPKGDGVFVPADEIWYFIELRNPGLDPTGVPKVQVKIDVEGKTKPGKVVKMGAPLSEVPAQELKGVTGHYAVGSSIPLSSFALGDYTFKVKLIDTVRKQTQEYEQAFRIVEGAK